MRQIRRAAARYYLIAKKIWAKLFPPSVAGHSAPMPIVTDGLANKVVIITGSTRGIGKALAYSFAAAGARVVVNGRGKQETEALASSFENSGYQVLAVAADVSTNSGAKNLIADTLKGYGHIDILINNAGVSGPTDKAVWNIEASEWSEVISTNLMAAVNCTAIAAKHAVKQKRPLRVLNVSSGIAGHGMENLGPYSVSKDALEGLTRAYRCDREDGLVCICSIQPRSVRSSMTQEYFDTASYLLMDDAEAVTDVFLWAASAPIGEVHGRSFNDAIFEIDQAAARKMLGPLVGSHPILLDPLTFAPGANLENLSGSHMHLLENSLGFYPSAAQALTNGLNQRGLYAYPDPNYRELKQAIAREMDLNQDQIGLGAGSSEIINRVLALFTEPGDRIIVTKPTWSFFNAFMQRWKLLPVKVSMRGSLEEGNLRHDLEGMLDAIGPGTRILYLVNPCNPSGSMLPAHEIERFVTRIPPHVILILDEAYIQYADPELRPNPRKLIDDCPGNLLILRTFSKFFALSGLRVGFACGTPESIDLLSRGEMPFGITSPAARLVPEVLNDHEFRQRVFDTNLQGRRQLATGLVRLDIPFVPSGTNFVLISCPTDPQILRDDLLKQGLVLPNVDQFLQNYALLAIGLEEHNDRVLQALSKY